LRRLVLLITLVALAGVRSAPFFEVIKPDQIGDIDAMMDLAVEIGSINIYFAVMPETEWTGSKEQRKCNVTTITGVIVDIGRDIIAYVSYENTEYPGVFAVVTPDGLEALFDDERVIVLIYGTLAPSVYGTSAEWVGQ
jgi:hypothetical protein